MRAPPTKKKKRGEHQKQASHDDEDKNKASAEPPSKVRAIGARRHVRVKKKKKERRKRNKKRNTKPQTKETRPRTTGKRGMTTKYVTAPCVLHIVSTATHTWMRKPSMLRRRAPRDNTARKKERRTATHVKRHARKHKPQPYIPHISSSIGPDRREIHEKKKIIHKSAKGMGRPRTKGKQ